MFITKGVLIIIAFIVSSSTYTGVPPGRTETEGTEAHGCLLEVTGPIPTVDPGWYQRVSEPESCTLKRVAHSRVNVRFVALVWRQAFPHEGRQVLVCNYVLLRETDVRHWLQDTSTALCSALLCSCLVSCIPLSTFTMAIHDHVTAANEYTASD